MKKLILILIFLLIAIPGYADIFTASSCEYIDVNTKITEAADGDTVVVPANNGNTCIWPSPLIITKLITLQGQGAANTVITSNLSSTTSGLIEFAPGKAVSGTEGKPSFRLTGFTLDGANKSMPLRLVGSPGGTYTVKDVRIDHNTLIGMDGTNPIWVTVIGIMWGVLDNNTVYGRASVESGGNHAAWDSSSYDVGTADNLYFEDNIATHVGNNFFTSGHGSRYAARYNKMTNTTKQGNVFDVHGNMQGLTPGNKIFEAYGNYYDNGGFGGRYTYIYNGKNMVFFNKSVDSASSVTFDVLETDNDGLYYFRPDCTASGATLTCGTTRFPAAYTDAQVRIYYSDLTWEDRAISSRTSSTVAVLDQAPAKTVDSTTVVYTYFFQGTYAEKVQHVNNSYFFNNRKGDGNLIPIDLTQDSFINVDSPYIDLPNASPVLEENREFWQQRSSAYNGTVTTGCMYRDSSDDLVDDCGTTSGIGCGTLANRPESCVEGSAYWATAQSNCTDLTGYVGDSTMRTSGIATKIEGTLYICGASNWTDATTYAPYDYPHPLRDDAGTDETAPTLVAAIANGTSLTMTFSEAVSIGAGGNGGFTMTPSGGAATLSYASGSGSTTLVYTINRTLVQGETITDLAYTQPTNGVEDAAGNDLATFNSVTVTNHTESTPPEYTLTVTKTGTGCVITSSPSGVNCGATCERAFTTGTAVTLSGYLYNGWASISYGGACNGSGQVTMSEARECTVTCTPIRLWP